MKVIDKINELKGTNATIEDVIQWAYMNRVVLNELEYELQIEKEKFPIEFYKLINKVCFEETDELERYTLFLSMEV